jgi:hypothetical protein
MSQPNETNDRDGVIPASVRWIWHPLPFERRRAAREHATGGTSARLTFGGRSERQARLTAASTSGGLAYLFFCPWSVPWRKKY